MVRILSLGTSVELAQTRLFGFQIAVNFKELFFQSLCLLTFLVLYYEQVWTMIQEAVLAKNDDLTNVARTHKMCLCRTV